MDKIITRPSRGVMGVRPVHHMFEKRAKTFRVIQKLGGKTETAKRLAEVDYIIQRGSISQWMKRGSIPPGAKLKFIEIFEIAGIQLDKKTAFDLIDSWEPGFEIAEING